MIALEENGKALGQRLYEALTAAILSGRYRAGGRLPSSRELAAELSISRNTVNAAYARLEAEGYVVSKASSGIFAAEGLRPAKAPARERPRAMDAVGFRAKRSDIVDFKSGLPDGRFFPAARWASIVASVVRAAPPAAFGYGAPEGRLELREAIAAYLARYRAARCSPEDIVVCAGTTQAIGIAARVLGTDTRRTALVEDPLTMDIKAILAVDGYRVIPVPLEGRGFDAAKIKRGLRPSLIYVTPCHQYPTGVSMPIGQRLALLEYAKATGASVVEDDYDSEFRFDGPPLPSLQGLAPESVVYIGTFSKTLSPALRAGYLVFPPRLVRAAREAKWRSDLHNPVLDQLALARFLSEGHYARHVARMKRLYRNRRACLVAALETSCAAKGIRLEILGDAAGLHLAARFPGCRFTRERLAAFEAAGVKVYPVSMHAINPKTWDDALILGYGSLDEEEIEKGVGILADFAAKEK